MPLHDVSNDPSLIGWLRQAGHGHLLSDHQSHYSNAGLSSQSPPIISGGHGHLSNDHQSHYANVGLSSPSPPIISGGHSSVDPYINSYNRSTSYSGVDPHTDSYNRSASYSGVDPHTDSYNRSASYSGVANFNTLSHTHQQSPTNFNTLSYNHQQSPTNFVSNPTQFLAPHMNQHQLDIDIEHMKHDPNTRVVQRPPPNDVVYRQRVFVRYLQPPTPPVSGAIIVREKQPPAPPPDPPLVLKRAPPPPPTPPPVVIRERPPLIPPPEPTTVINKIIPAPPKPPRQVIIEQFPQLPPKPQDVILERWLPVPPRQRRILYERLPAPLINQPTISRPIIIQHGQPRIRIHREIHNAPGSYFPHQQISGHTDINHLLSQFGNNQQISGHTDISHLLSQLGSNQQLSSHTDINHLLSQFGTNQQIHSTLSPSSLISYSPYSTIQQSYGNIAHPQSNIVVMQNDQSNILSSSSYGLPLSCVCAPNSTAGLGAYGSGISSIPTFGYSPGQSSVFSVSEHVPVDNILRQLGVDPYSIHQPTDPHSAISHVWNAASHVNSPYSLDPNSAVSHVWNAATHATDHYICPITGNVLPTSPSFHFG